jgi:pYEATS domain-containing protein involved in immunity
VDKMPQVPADRATQVVPLAAVTIAAVVGLAFADAAWGAYALVVLILVSTTVALKAWPELGLGEEGRREYVMALEFRRFRSELTQADTTKAIEGDYAQRLEQLRVEEYETNRGLFLGHYWRPSEEEGQVADIRIFLHAHRHPDGKPTPLEEGTVESVTYYLGPKFPSEDATTKRNNGDAFALDITAYGPVLCLAEVTFSDGSDPLYLNRYIDFPEDLQTSRTVGVSAQVLYNVEAPTPRWKRLWRRMFGR